MTAPAAPRRRGRGRMVALMIVGILLDICAVANVPGVASYTMSEAGEREVSIAGPGTFLVLLVIACWVALLWHRTQPALVVGAGCLLAVIGISYLLLLVAAVVVVRARPERLKVFAVLVPAVIAFFVLREAVTSWGGALGWFFGSQSAGEQGVEWIWGSVIVAVVSCGVAALIVYGSATSRRAAQSDERAAQSDQRAAQQQRRAEMLAEQVIRQAERDRIARDMHDSLAHRLSVVSLHAGALATAADAGAAGEMARTVQEQTHAALQDMRGLIGDLRSGPGESAPATMRALGALVMDLRRGGTPIASHIMIESAERASVEFDSAVYRIVQEALTNAVKHASGGTIDVFVQVEPQSGARIRVVNVVRSDAVSVVPGGGNGILGIRERTHSLRGTAWIGSHEGEFIVDVTIPWQERSEAVDSLSM